MKIKEIFKNSLGYTISDWKRLFIFGLVILLTDQLIGLNSNIVPTWLDAIGTLIAFIFTILSAGYVFRILEETVRGSDKLPKFNRFRSLASHGAKETLVAIFYTIVPIFFLLISLGLIDEYITVEFADLTLTFFLITSILIGVSVSLYFQGVMLNMAHKHGKLRSGFQFIQIWRRLRIIGFKKLILVSIFIFIILYILQEIIFESLHSLPLVGDVIASLFIAPFLIIFTTRMLGLIDLK